MLTRRDFFRGTTLGAGGLLFSNFLSQLEAAASDSPARPMRFVFFLQGNGIYPDQIQPAGIDRPREPSEMDDRLLAGHALARSVDPLEPFKDRMMMLNGLSGRVARGSHSSDFGALGCYPQNKGAYGETIDAALAKQLGGIFPHIGLGLQSEPDRSIIYNVSAWDRSKALPTQCNPLLAFERYFASAAEGDARKAFDAKTNVLDFLADDVKRMQSQLNAGEKAKLDHYLEAFEAMSNRQSALVRESQRIRRAAPDTDERYTSEGMLFERLEAQFEIAAATLIAGLTNVLTLSSGSGLGGTGVSPDGTEIGLEAGKIGSHGIGHGGSVQGQTSTELHIRIRRRHMELLAAFANKLAAVPEGDGSLLDNTLIIYMSDAAEGHHPGCKEWPVILLGDLGGRLKTKGRYLRYPWYGNNGHRTMANLFTTLLHVAGDRRERFGLADLALRDLDQDGPLAELM